MCVRPGRAGDPQASGKMTVLESMLAELRQPAQPGAPAMRIVVVAGWTSSLDAIQALCSRLQLQARVHGDIGISG